MSQEQPFSQIWDLCRNTTNNISFHYRTNSVKINDQIFHYTQKNLSLGHFWSIFPNIWRKKFFSRNYGSIAQTSYGYLAPNQNSEKTNANSKKTPGQKDGRKDGETLFYRTLPASDGGPIKRNNVGLISTQNIIKSNNYLSAKSNKPTFPRNRA